MKILIPYDIATTGKKNPYLYLLMRELYKLDFISEVQHGYGWLGEPGKWDIIHLHWPELLIKSQLRDMSRTDLLKNEHFERVLNSIKQMKSEGARVVITIHNEKPHKGNEGLFADYFREIYSLSDGFIHMGGISGILLEDEYPSETKGKPSFIIPHGDYSYFPQNLKRSECRKKLNIREDEKLLLTFGAIRSRQELELGIDAFKKAGIKKSVYLIAGSLPIPYKSNPEYFRVRRKLFTNVLNRRIRTEEKVIVSEEVQIYLKAADQLFIPRFNTLNSGNVALGFTFGKVVTGPYYGVIGEVLKDNGNPVFDPEKISSVSDAIRVGFMLAESGHGIKNKEYANHFMDWSEIAKKTVEAYKTL